MKLKVLAVLIVIAALAGGWKWSTPKSVTHSAAPPAFAHSNNPVVAPSGWTWGEE